MSENLEMALNELMPPPEAVGNSTASEVLRCWIVNDSLFVSMAPLIFSRNVETWGMLLADVGRHLAHSFEQEGVDSYEGARRRIRELFDSEWDRPTGIAKTEDLKKQ